MREVEKEEEEVALGFTFSIHFHGLLQKLSKTSPVLRGSIEQSEDHEDDEHYEDVDDEHYEDAPDSEDEGDSGEEGRKKKTAKKIAGALQGKGVKENRNAGKPNQAYMCSHLLTLLERVLPLKACFC